MTKAVITLLAALAFAGGSLISNEFGGFDPNRFPIPQDNPPLQPVGFAFSIWFPIYCWLIASGVYGVFKRPAAQNWQDFRWPLILTTLVGAPWLKVAKVSPVWSTIMIWLMLGLGLVALWKAPKEDFAWARGPIGLYAGWLTAASAVGSSVLLAGYGILPAQTAAVFMLLVALAMALTVLLRSSFWNPSYAFGMLWALAGVILKSLGNNSTMVLLSAIGCLAIALALWKKKP